MEGRPIEMPVQLSYEALRQGFRNFQDNPLTPFPKGELFCSFRGEARAFKRGASRPLAPPRLSSGNTCPYGDRLAFCVQTQAMKDGGVQVVHVDPVFHHIEAEVVSLSDDLARLDSAASHPHRE